MLRGRVCDITIFLISNPDVLEGQKTLFLKVLKRAACFYCRVTSYVCQHQERFGAPFHGSFKTEGRVSYFLLMSIRQVNVMNSKRSFVKQ